MVFFSNDNKLLSIFCDRNALISSSNVLFSITDPVDLYNLEVIHAPPRIRKKSAENKMMICFIFLPLKLFIINRYSGDYRGAINSR